MKRVQSREAYDLIKKTDWEGTNVLIHLWFAFPLKRPRLFGAILIQLLTLSHRALRTGLLLALSFQLGQMAQGQTTLQRQSQPPTTVQPGQSGELPLPRAVPAAPITNPQQVPG